MLRLSVFALAAIVASSVGCASEAGDDNVAGEDALSTSESTGPYPALVSERDFPRDLVTKLKERARTSTIRAEASRGKGSITLATMTRGDLLVVGVVADERGTRVLKDVRMFSQNGRGKPLALVKHDAMKATVTPPPRGAQALAATPPKSSVTGTEGLAQADIERATSAAVLTTYMAVASGRKAKSTSQPGAPPLGAAPLVQASSRPVWTDQDNRCSGLDPLGDWALYIPQKLEFNVLACCQAHDAALACNCDASPGATIGDNQAFIACVDRKAGEAFSHLRWYVQIATGALFALERALLVDLLGSIVINIGTELSGQRGKLCGQDSCVCGGSRPTVGVDPRRCKNGQNPHDCVYENYEYTMLCRGTPNACR